MTGADEAPFTHDGPGTPAQAWREHPGWGAGEPVTLHGVDRVVVLAAHPDDESLGAGGLLAAASRAGLPVELVCVTDGEGSHPHSPTTPPEDLAARRRDEVLAAAALLGIPAERVHHLGIPDGGVRHHAAAVDDRPRRPPR